MQAASGRPFSWGGLNGGTDCCLFACDAVRAMTGLDPASPFRGRYQTKRGAVAALRRFAGGGIPETAEKIARELGAPEVPPMTAQRGDVVLTDQGPWLALGVCVGATVAVAGVQGIERQPLSRAVRAWRVG